MLGAAAVPKIEPNSRGASVWWSTAWSACAGKEGFGEAGQASAPDRGAARPRSTES